MSIDFEGSVIVGEMFEGKNDEYTAQYNKDLTLNYDGMLELPFGKFWHPNKDDDGTEVCIHGIEIMEIPGFCEEDLSDVFQIPIASIEEAKKEFEEETGRKANLYEYIEPSY